LTPSAQKTQDVLEGESKSKGKDSHSSFQLVKKVQSQSKEIYRKISSSCFEFQTLGSFWGRSSTMLEDAEKGVMFSSR